jgi:Icc-related predicted phosphoesterase
MSTETAQRITCISDTHGRHAKIGTLKECDILIHAGDVTYDGGSESLKEFLVWFESQPAKHKCFVAGNHDWVFEHAPKAARRLIKKYAPSVTYLEDDWARFDGIRVYGSPVQPEFLNWAFNRKRGADIKKHWDRIQRDTDILVTHGPAFGVLDTCEGRRGENLGCEELAKAIDRIKPKVHCFGHIHTGYGILEKNGTISVNASLLNEEYAMVHDPVYITL